MAMQPEHRKLYGSARWKKLRFQVLTEDGPLCRLRLPGCTGVADTVDHVVPVRDWAEGMFVRSNCRPSCKHCNASRGGRQDGLDTRPRPAALKFFDVED
ncbi:HNH endonuclease [Mycolicibacterium sp. XJ662]